MSVPGTYAAAHARSGPWRTEVTGTNEIRSSEADAHLQSEPSRDGPADSSRLRRVGLIIVLVGVLLAWTWWWRGRLSGPDAPPLKILASVPDFSLIERDGKAVSRDDLLGSLWIADFIFTRCAGPCPTLSLRMRSLQEGIEKYGGNVKLVSFSVDPTYDQPPVLRTYAKHYQADPKLWWFLTCGDEATMYKVVREGFLQTVVPAGKVGQITHSTYFVLVDRQGRIRAFYEGLEAASKPLILRDVERVPSEPAG